MSKSKIYILFSTAVNLILLIAVALILINQNAAQTQNDQTPNPGLADKSAPAKKVVEQKNINRVNITIDDKGFSPKGFQINAGDKTIATIENKDKQAHSFSVDSLGINLTVAPGEKNEAIIEPKTNEAGMLKFESKTEGDSADIFSGVIMVLKQEAPSTATSTNPKN